MTAAPRERGVVLGVILVGYLLIVVDVSILMAALPRIRADLGFSVTGLSWAQNAYTLTFGGLLLFGARVGDLLGRRRTFMLGIGLFAVASLAVGLAQSTLWMISARATQGIGAAMLAPATLALLSASFPEGRDRDRAMAAYGALAGIGTAFGLIVGGVLTSALSWRYGFFVNVPIGIAVIFAAPRFLEETPRHTARLDVSGALSSTLGASAVVFGIVQSAVAGWRAASTIVSLAVGIVLIALFVVNQARAEQPLMPLRLFADRRRAGAYGARFLFNAVLVSFFFFMTQYLQGVAGYNPLQAGLAFLPVTAAAFAAAALTARAAVRVSNSTLAIAGCAAMLVGTAWMSRVSVNPDYLLGIALPMIVFGIGQGLGLSSLTSAGMENVMPQDAAVAGGLVNVAHHLGGAAGLGILVTIFEAAGTATDSPHVLLAARVFTTLAAACVFLALAVTVILTTRTRQPSTEPQADPTIASSEGPRTAVMIAEERVVA